MMSKRHSALLKQNSNHVPTQDTIYEAAEEVWRDIPSAEIARGFVLAYRIACMMDATEGSSNFLSGNKFHSNVRHDFYSTNKGIKPIRSGKRGPNIVGLKIKNTGDGTKDEPTNELNIAASHNIKVEPNTDEGII